MTDGVVYIKIAKTDKNGINQTNTLQSLNQVTIPYSTGNITYKVLNIVEHPTFFLYYVNPAGVEWADRAEIKYDFTGSLSGNLFQNLFNLQLKTVPIVSSEKDSLNFYISSSQQYVLNTYPQKELHFIVTGSYTSQIQFGFGSAVDLRIYASPEPGQDLPLGSMNLIKSEALSSGINQNLNVRGSYTPLSPHTEFKIMLIGQGLTGGQQVQLTGSQFFITSSDATGLQVGLVPEPYFGSNDFKRALDCQPLLNNVDTNRRHNLYQDVDYSAGITEPTNFDLLISGSALRAEVQLSNYTTRRHVIPRYEGSKSTSQKLNKWSKGDTGTFGKTPTIESLKTVIAYCDFIAGWPPDRMNASTAHVLYLIDADGNIGVPNTSENSLPNVQGSFQTGERFRISSRTIGSGEPDPLRTVIRGGQRIEPILYTQIGKQPGAEWTSSINLIDIQSTSGSATQDYQNSGTIPEKNIPVSNGKRRERLSLLSFLSNSNLIGTANYPVTSNDYNYYEVPIGVVNEGITLHFNYSFILEWSPTEAAQNGYGYSTSIGNSTIGGSIGVILFINGTSYTFQTSELTINQISSGQYLAEGFFDITPGSVTQNDQISLEYVLNGGYSSWKASIIEGSYSITQTPIPTQDINVGNNAIWGFYDKTNYPYVITSSDAVSESLGALYGDLNVKQTDIPDSGFEPIALPWSIKYGDEFRFEGDERFTYMVGEVYGPNEGLGSRLTPTGSIEVQFNKNLPVSASISSFNLDHFLIRRYIDDASQIIFKGEKPLQSQGPFILTPEFSTKELNVNIDDVVTNLKERGLITGEEGT